MHQHFPIAGRAVAPHPTTPSNRAPRHSRRTWIWATPILVLVVVLGALARQTTPAGAAQIASQCNGEMNGGGTEVACTVTVVNYLTSSGSLAATPPSTLTLTRCVGATGPLSTLTCTTTVTTLTEPVGTVQQCNGSGNGGGGAVVCTVTVTNHFVGAPAAITAATVYQCMDSDRSGPGAPGTCLPANTEGVTSVSQATVGQCNGTGNGGTLVFFSCTVAPGSTTTTTAPINVDQCNDSGNGGGAVVTCQATVVNTVVPQSTATNTTPTGAASATTTSTTGTPTAGTATGTPASATPTATTSSTPTAPGLTPGASGSPTGQGPGSTSTPLAPAVGSGPASADSSQWPAVLGVGFLALGLVSVMVLARPRR